MKKRLLFSIFLLNFHTLSFTQICLPEGITFSTQTDIDEFSFNYPDCSVIEGDVFIYSQDESITNLDGLSNITSINGKLRIGNVTNKNPGLTSLSGLNNLTSVGGTINIRYNSSLVSLSGLENLTTAGGGAIDITGNSVLENLAGLSGLVTLPGALIIEENNFLTDLSGLENLTTIGTFFDLINNASLTGLGGLSGLTSIGGYLFVVHNPLLTDLSGLENLNSIGQYLQLSVNASLVNLTGLESLSTIPGALYITENPVLASLSGLNNIESVGGEIQIQFNPLLTDCIIQVVCNNLTDPDAVVIIQNNAAGCNSPEEVEAACIVGISEADRLSFSIYPNPAQNEIYISSENGIVIDEVNIYNQLGQNVIHQNNYRGSVDVFSLMPGVYFVEVVDGSVRAREKLVIE